MRGRCQICGRRLGERKKGGMVAHHVRGLPCPGEGLAPLEQTDEGLEALIGKYRAERRALRLQLAALIERRANWIDPRLKQRIGFLDGQVEKLERRLKRHRSWPARFERQMEREGWGMRPPEYLISRYIEEKGWTPQVFR